jgi:hypothetical protein
LDPILNKKIKNLGTQINNLDAKATSLQGQVNVLVVEGDSSVEAAQARVNASGTTFTNLKARLDNGDSELANIAPKPTVNALAEIYDTTVHDTETGALRIQVGGESNLNAMQTYNNTGVEEGGTHTNADGMETQLVHHYNDKNVAQWDNVGRGNTILKLKQARNSIMAKHDQTGSGNYIELERDCSDLKSTYTITHDSSITRIVDLAVNDVVYDKYSYNIYKSLTARLAVDLWGESFNDGTKWSYITGFGNEQLMTMKAVNLKTEGLTTTDDYVVGFWGRMGGKLKDLLFKPIYFFTKGNINEYGQPAIQLYSLNKGGSLIKTKNIGNSKGASIYVENYSSEVLSPGMRIDGKSSNSMYNGYNYSNSPYLVFQSMNTTNPDILSIKDVNGNFLFKISGDGKTIFMIDSGDGTLKSLSITNGAVTVS